MYEKDKELHLLMKLLKHFFCPLKIEILMVKLRDYVEIKHKRLSFNCQRLPEAVCTDSFIFKLINLDIHSSLDRSDF